MDNQRLKGLITGWRDIENKLRDQGKYPGLSDSEAWIAANFVSQIVGEIESLVIIDEETIKKQKKE